ncbi:hypothetical protein ACJX0J_008157, partial [Zea mays]
VVLFDQRYIGMTWEENMLNILLEFVPGGSIQSLLGRLGSFPEALIFRVFSVGHANKTSYNCFPAIIRHNQPKVWAFCLGNGYAGLKDALGSNDSRLQSRNAAVMSPCILIEDYFTAYSMNLHSYDNLLNIPYRMIENFLAVNFFYLCQFVYTQIYMKKTLKLVIRVTELF